MLRRDSHAAATRACPIQRRLFFHQPIEGKTQPFPPGDLVLPDWPSRHRSGANRPWGTSRRGAGFMSPPRRHEPLLWRCRHWRAVAPTVPASKEEAFRQTLEITGLGDRWIIKRCHRTGMRPWLTASRGFGVIPSQPPHSLHGIQPITLDLIVHETGLQEGSI